MRFDNTKTLHTSIFYFCCHGPIELVRIREALLNMKWASFTVEYDTFGCNIDTHGSNITYLHALPSKRYQDMYFALTKKIEETVSQAGVEIHHPRKSLFHMTLARVTPEYPSEKALATLNGTHFGSHRVCSFEFLGAKVTAGDCP